MTDRDRIKLINAGFSIIRKDDSNPDHPRIEYFSCFSEQLWLKALAKFTTTEERDDVFKTLLNFDTFIEG